MKFRLVPLVCENENSEGAEEDVGREFIDNQAVGNAAESTTPDLPCRDSQAPAYNGPYGFALVTHFPLTLGAKHTTLLRA